MDYKSIEKRLTAAGDLLSKREINRATIDSLKTLLFGIHPSLDKKLDLVSREFKHIEHLQKSDVVNLVAEALPEMTPEQKKRKKALLLFLKFWNDLKSEVSRVQKELDKQSKGQRQSQTIANILSVAKGPLAIVTIIAVGIVALKATEVSILIKNINCESVTPGVSVAITIPGLSVPENIPRGGEAVAKLPPLFVSVDATSVNQVQLAMYGMKYSFFLRSANTQLVFDGQTLNGTKSDINLGSQKQHTLVLTCK